MISIPDISSEIPLALEIRAFGTGWGFFPIFHVHVHYLVGTGEDFEGGFSLFSM